MAAPIGCAVCLLATLLLLPPAPGGAQQKPGGKTAEGQQEPDGTKADVMFVLDITGSMKFAIDGVESGLERILKKFKDRQIDAYVGLTVFRDTHHSKQKSPNDKVAGIKDDPWTFKFKGGSAFTTSSKEYRAVVSKLKAEGGGDIPENSLEAMKVAATAPTRKGVSRIMVLITDAPPHPGATLEKRVIDTRTALVSHKYHHVYLMTKPEDRAVYEQIWNKTAPHVDGMWFEIATPAAAFAGILDSVTEQAIKDVIRRRKK